MTRACAWPRRAGPSLDPAAPRRIDIAAAPAKSRPRARLRCGPNSCSDSARQAWPLRGFIKVIPTELVGRRRLRPGHHARLEAASHPNDIGCAHARRCSNNSTSAWSIYCNPGANI